MTKGQTTFHSTMYARKGNSWSYIIQFVSHGRPSFGKVVCYILYDGVAYALLEKYDLTGVNICQDLNSPQDIVLNEIAQKKFSH